MKVRLAHSLEDWLMKTQFGFRKRKSTSEASGKKLAIVLLDWEKAFDKIDHDRLRESLRRLEVPTHLLAIVNDIDANPKS